MPYCPIWDGNWYLVVVSWWMWLNCCLQTYRSLSVQATMGGQLLCCSHAEMSSSCPREIISEKRSDMWRHPPLPLLSSSSFHPHWGVGLMVFRGCLFFCAACSTLSDTTVPLLGWQQDVGSSARESTWKGVNESAGTPSNEVLLKSLYFPVVLPHEDSARAPNTLLDVLLDDSSY